MSSGHVFVVTRVASDSMKRGFLLYIFWFSEVSELCVDCKVCELCEFNESCEPSEPSELCEFNELNELCERMKSRVWNPSGAMSMIMHRRKYFRWPWSTVEIMNMKRGMNGKWFMIFSIKKVGSCWGMRLVYAS